MTDREVIEGATRRCSECGQTMMTLLQQTPKGITVVFFPGGSRAKEHYDRAWACQQCGRIELIST